jgi:hypothetical protein
MDCSFRGSVAFRDIVEALEPFGFQPIAIGRIFRVAALGRELAEPFRISFGSASAAGATIAAATIAAAGATIAAATIAAGCSSSC